jgi:membrane protein
MVLVIGFLLMVSLVINTLLSALQGYINKVLDSYSVYAIQIGQNAASLAIITLLFAMMFKYLPDVIIPWKRVWGASLLTAVLFTVGKSIIGFYLGKTNAGSTYGAAASIIIILLWVNYSAWIFFLGAEYIYITMLRKKEIIQPSRFAARLRISVEEEG